MSIRFMLSIALMTTTQFVHAETFMKYEHRDTAVTNVQYDITYEYPGELTDTIAQDESRIMLERIGAHRNFRRPVYYPEHIFTKLALNKNTRFKIGRSVLKYKLSNRKHTLEKLYERRRVASII